MSLQVGNLVQIQGIGVAWLTNSYIITMAANVLISTTLTEEHSMSATNGQVLISRSISPSILYPEMERERRDREIYDTLFLQVLT